jgi:hypothetical protein
VILKIELELEILHSVLSESEEKEQRRRRLRVKCETCSGVIRPNQEKLLPVTLDSNAMCNPRIFPPLRLGLDGSLTFPVTQSPANAANCSRLSSRLICVSLRFEISCFSGSWLEVKTCSLDWSRSRSRLRKKQANKKFNFDRQT